MGLYKIVSEKLFAGRQNLIAEFHPLNGTQVTGQMYTSFGTKANETVSVRS